MPLRPYITINTSTVKWQTKMLHFTVKKTFEMKVFIWGLFRTGLEYINFSWELKNLLRFLTYCWVYELKDFFSRDFSEPVKVALNFLHFMFKKWWFAHSPDLQSKCLFTVCYQHSNLTSHSQQHLKDTSKSWHVFSIQKNLSFTSTDNLIWFSVSWYL